MTDDLLARARAYAFEKWPPDHEVDDPYGETGVARSDEYGYDETARVAALHMAEWLLGQLPDREAVARRIDPGAFTDWQSAHDPRHVGEGRQRQEAALIKADAVLDLIRSGVDRG